MKCSYDYSDLLEELKIDVLEGLVKDELFIVRSNKTLMDGYRPIIDYYDIDYVITNGVEEEDKFLLVKKNVGDVINEMEEKNNIF